ALAAACTSPAEPEESPAYDFMLPIGAGVVYHWAPGSTVRIYVDPAGDPARDRLLEGAVGEAIGAWSEALEGADIALARVAALSEAEVLVRWAESPLPVATVGCEPVVLGRAAATCCPPADSATMARS